MLDICMFLLKEVVPKECRRVSLRTFWKGEINCLPYTSFILVKVSLARWFTRKNSLYVFPFRYFPCYPPDRVIFFPTIFYLMFSFYTFVLTGLRQIIISLSLNDFFSWISCLIHVVHVRTSCVKLVQKEDLLKIIINVRFLHFGASMTNTDIGTTLRRLYIFNCIGTSLGLCICNYKFSFMT